jgi:membrane associated rhomboid family serine protease
MLRSMNAPAPGSASEKSRNHFNRLGQALLWPTVAVGGLWLVAAVQSLTGINYVWLGVFPRTLSGLPGVVTAPLIHESWHHLLSNTAPLLGLGVIAMYGFPRATRHAVPLIWLLSGLGVWLFGRESFHIGISGLTHGLMFYVVLMGFLRRDPLSIALALIVFLLFGGMASGVIPSEPAISFEYHLFGAVAGVLAAVGLRRMDRMPVRIRRYSEDAEIEETAATEDPTSSESNAQELEDIRDPRRDD